jgi:hypothetical protein
MYGTKSADSTLEGRGKAERDARAGAGKVGEEEPSEYSTEMTAVDGPYTVAFQTTLAYTAASNTHMYISDYMQYILYASCIYGSSLLLYKALPCYLSNLKFSMRYFQFLFLVTLFSTFISLTP